MDMKAPAKDSKAAPAASVNDSPKSVLSSDPAIENLLSEIAATAYATELRLRETPGDDPELTVLECDVLRDVVKRMGWMADVALSRLGSLSNIHNGDAAFWLLPPVCALSLNNEVQA
jgi:hypothetical protein